MDRIPFFCFFIVVMVGFPLIMINLNNEVLFSLFPVVFFVFFYFMVLTIVYRSKKT